MITWGQFKKAAEEQGIKDDSVLDFIDWSGPWFSSKVNDV